MKLRSCQLHKEILAASVVQNRSGDQHARAHCDFLLVGFGRGFRGLRSSSEMPSTKPSLSIPGVLDIRRGGFVGLTSLAGFRPIETRRGIEGNEWSLAFEAFQGLGGCFTGALFHLQKGPLSTVIGSCRGALRLTTSER